jgi:hypothetical protein
VVRVNRRSASGTIDRRERPGGLLNDFADFETQR